MRGLDTNFALEFCNARSWPISDNDDEFLGTAIAISPNLLLTCEHCIDTNLTQVKVNNCNFSIFARASCSDLILLKSIDQTNLPFFIAASEKSTINEEIILYGYRERDGAVDNVLISTKIGMLSNRRLAHNCPHHHVYGFSKRQLVEHGMSGGVVLRETTLEMLGYIIGYDEPNQKERKDDIFVPLHSTVTANQRLRKCFTFSHQHRSIRTNLARRLLLLAGFTVTVERLTEDPSLDECLISTRGKGILKSIVLLVVANSEQMRHSESLKKLYKFSKEIVHSRNINCDHIFILVDEYKDLDFTITLEELRKSTPIGIHGTQIPNHAESTALITGRFLYRSAISSYEDTPKSIIKSIAKAIYDGIKLIVITGLAGSGKSSVVSEFIRDSEMKMLSGAPNEPIVFEFDLSQNVVGKISINKITNSGPVVVSLKGFNRLRLAGEHAKTIRKVKHIASELDSLYSEWSIIITTNGGTEQTKRGILPAFTEIESINSNIILELLPLSPEIVKQALMFELGASEGSSWWRTVESSQEIFQIAQWPAGLAILLDGVVQSSWNHHQANQVEVIGAIVSGFLSKITLRSEWRPPSATLNFLVALAEEINSIKKMQVPINRAKQIYAKVIPHTHSIHAIAGSDILVPGLISQALLVDSIEFDSPIFVHYLLSLSIINALESQDLSHLNPLYHRRMPVALLKDVVEHGVNRKQLWGLIKQTVNKNTNEVGFIGGNCISLLRLLGDDFKNCDLRNCNLRGGIFTECDLSDSEFNNSILIDVGLANSNLKNTKFNNSDLTRADLKSGCTVYQLAVYDQVIYAATSSRYLLRIELSNHQSLKFKNIRGFNDAVFAVAVSKSNNLIVAGGQDGTIRGWDLINNAPKFILRGHFSDIRSIAFAGNKIISGSVDGHVNLWSPWSASLISSTMLCGGEIWSICLISERLVAIQCDQNHLHIINIYDNSDHAIYDIPENYTRRLNFDPINERLFIGGPNGIWMLDLNTLENQIIEVPHPSIRTIFPIDNRGYLIGGTLGLVLYSNIDLKNFKEIYNSGFDYIADFTSIDDRTIIGSGAGGWLFMIAKNSGKWELKKEFGVIDSKYHLCAEGADFSEAKGIPGERVIKLKEAGAIFN